MNLTKAVQAVEMWNKAFEHIPEDDDTREKMWRYDDDWRLLAVRLVQEEVNELADGTRAASPLLTPEGKLTYETEMLPREKDVEVLDAIADILFTVFGVAAKAGLTELVEPAFQEVLRSNWTKMGPDGPEFYPNGKVSKPDTYEAPDLRQFFDEEDLV